MKKIKDSSDQHLYEVNYLVALRESERVLALAKKIEDWIGNRKGEVVEIEKEETPEKERETSKVWVEKKRLAYSVKKERAGYYLNSWVKLNPADMDDFMRFLKLEKEIIRFAIMVDDRAVDNIQPVKETTVLSEINQLALQQFPSRGQAFRTRAGMPASPNRPDDLSAGAAVREKVNDRVPAEKRSVVSEERKSEDIAEDKKEKWEKKVQIEEKGVEAKIESKAKKQVKLSKEESPKEKEEEKIPQKSLKDGKKLKDKDGIAVKEEKPKEIEKESEEGKEKPAKHKKISLEDLDKRLDDILNEDIL